jgi:hypothetical protein
MATLLPDSPALTALMLIDRAYSLLGFKAAGEPLAAADAQCGLDALNALLDGWSTQPLSIVSVQEIVALVAASPVTVGLGMDADIERPARMEGGAFVRVAGVDCPLTWIGRERFNAICQKSDAGQPEFAYYDAALPVGNVFLWPQPSAPFELHLQLHAPQAQFVNVTDECVLAPGYRKAIEYSLAEELAPGIKELPLTVVRTAANARRAIRRTNVRVPLLDVRP